MDWKFALPFVLIAAMGIVTHFAMYFESNPIFGSKRWTIASYMTWWR